MSNEFLFPLIEFLHSATVGLCNGSGVMILANILRISAIFIQRFFLHSSHRRKTDRSSPKPVVNVSTVLLQLQHFTTVCAWIVEVKNPRVMISIMLIT